MLVHFILIYQTIPIFLHTKNNYILYLSIPHQLHDPRAGFAEDSNASSSTKTHQTECRWRNRRQQLSPPITVEI
jgi:hypothetical protein